VKLNGASFETANHETDRLARLVNDVLICHDSNPAASTYLAVDLAQAIEQTLRTYQLNARDKGIELVQDVAPTCHRRRSL